MAFILDEAGRGWVCPRCERGVAPQVRECSCRPQYPLNFSPAGGETPEEPIWVPARDGVTPGQIADAQHLLRYTARHIVKGQFVVLPPGAKILPAHPGWVKVPDEMAGPHYSRIVRVDTEWTEAWNGLQVRWNGAWGGEPAASVEFRLTPQGDGA